MSISREHRPYSYSEFIPELDSKDFIEGVKLKQNLYDQGVQMIQAKIDQLTGFDIARDVDRKYVNQELSKIYSVISDKSQNADFSNTQTIRSFLDITRPLDNDPNFRNAIQSTMELRNRQKVLNDIMTKRPESYSAANAWEYMRDVEKWSSNPNPGAVLNAKQYTPYRDLSKKITDIVSKVKADVESSMRDTGNFLTQLEIEQITKDKVKNAVMTQLSADDLNQLRIDSDFTIRGMSFEEKYNSLFSFYSGIATNPDVSDDDRKAAREVLEEINTTNDQELIDRYASNVYTSNFMEGIGNAYQYRNVKQKMIADPFALESVKFTHAKALKNMQNQFDLEKMVLEGKAIKNADGTYSTNPNYKSSSGEDDNFFIFDSTTTGASSANPIDTKATEDAIARGEYSGTHDMDQMSPALQTRLKAFTDATAGSKAYSNFKGLKVVFSPATESIPVGTPHYFSGTENTPFHDPYGYDQYSDQRYTTVKLMDGDKTVASFNLLDILGSDTPTTDASAF